jgi:hypothetical protein
VADAVHACSVCATAFTRRDGAVLRVGRRIVYLCPQHTGMARAGAQAGVRALAVGARSLLQQKAPNLYKALEAVNLARSALRDEQPTIIDAEVIHER